MYLSKKTSITTAYGAGFGNVPALFTFMSVGHLRAVFYFLNHKSYEHQRNHYGCLAFCGTL